MRLRVVVLCFSLLTATAAFPQTRVIQRFESLKEPLRLNVDELIFEKDAFLITNGHEVSIKARNIKFRGGVWALIVAFDGSTRRAAPGQAGRSAGPISIEADHVDLGIIEILNDGQYGGDGLPGRDGFAGSTGMDGEPRRYALLRGGCYGGTDGVPGANGGPGERGGNGGRGGDGGKITVIAPRRALVAFRLNARPGEGGFGGPGGIGGPGGRGGTGAPATRNCGGTSPGNSGHRGPDGARGERGSSGSPAETEALVK